MHRGCQMRLHRGTDDVPRCPLARVATTASPDSLAASTNSLFLDFSPVTCRLLLAKIEPYRLGQFPLAIVEGQKALRFEFESAGDVEAVKSTNTQFGTVAPAEIAAYLEGVVGHGSFEPQSGEPVTPQVVEDFVRIGVRNFATKDLLDHSMEEFRRMKGTKQKTSTSGDPASRGRGVDVGQIQGHKNAAVGIDRQ